MDVFFQDYESKLEALQKQVDSRYLESPEEEEEPEEEGKTDMLQYSRHTQQSLNLFFCKNVLTLHLSCPFSAVDSARDRAGSVGVQKVAFLPVHLPQGSALGQRHLP